MSDALTEMTAEAVEVLKKMISIPSFSREEKKVADMLESFLLEKGYAVSRIGNNIWLQSPGFNPSMPTLLLNSHVDTVKPVEGWIKDPFVPENDNDGNIYGLGSNDAGASVVSLMQAFFYLSSCEQPYNLIFAATAEEEVSGKGGIELLLSELPRVDFAIVGEPTGMHPAIAEKGLMVLDGKACGKAGHAARDEGENAIYKAMVDIEWLRTHRFERKSDLLGPVKMSVTQVNAGTQHNVVPDVCSFVVDVRTNELYKNEEIIAEIRSNVTSEITPRSTRLNSTATPVNHPLVKKMIEAGRVPFGSPTLSDQALLPFPSVKIGPGESARSHTANEYVLENEIRSAIDLYIFFLDKMTLW